jgi:hypothetical protein
MRKSIITILGVILMTLFIGIALADPWETYKNTAYSRSDVVIGPTFDFTTSAAGTATLTNGVTIPSGKVLAGDVTGTASRIAVGSFIDTAYALKNSTSNKAQVNISANMGLRLGTGATQGSIELYPGDGIDVGASGTAVDVTDIVDHAHGIDETTTNNIGVNLTADKGLEFGTGSAEGSLQVEAGNGIKLSSSGVAVEPTDIIDTSYGLMDNSDDIRINLTPNAGLEFSAVGATLGSLGINLDGYSLTLGSSGIKINGTDTIEVAGVVASGNSYLNTTVVGTGATLDTADADGVKSGGVIVPQEMIINVPITTSEPDQTVFIADDAWQITKIEEVHATAQNTAYPNTGSVTVTKCTGTQAAASGSVLHNATMYLNNTAETVQTPTLNAATGALNLADGNRLAINVNGTMDTFANGLITIHMKRI